MNIKKLAWATILTWIVSTAIIWLTCGWLFTWVYEIPPTIWLSAEEMMSTSNMLGSNIVSLIGCLVFVCVFTILYKGIPGKGIKKGLYYGLLVWLVGAAVGMATMPFYMTISTTVIIYWILQALVINLVKGAIVAKIFK